MGCVESGCPAKVLAKGLCKKHYMRQYMRGYDNSQYQKRWRRKNRKKLRALNRQYYKTNRPQRLLDSSRRGLKKKCEEVGIDLATYNRLAAEQRGRCAICGDDPAPKRLSVDHTHATKKFRGLVCGNCNTGLGMFKDSVQRLRAAITYLSR